MFLVANQVDLVIQRIISYDEGIEKANEYGIDYIETSVMLDYNVDELFSQLTDKITKYDK